MKLYQSLAIFADRNVTKGQTLCVTQDGRFRNSQYEVWDVVPRNVLVDDEGDIFVVDAEIKHLG